MESMSGSGHVFARSRLRLGDKLEMLRLDPWGMPPGLFALFFDVISFCFCENC